MVALPFTQRPVETESLVVVALTKVVKPVTPRVPVSVEFPTTAKSLCVEIAPAEVVVALPLTQRSVETESLVVVALPSVVKPRASNVLCVEIAPAEVVVALPLTQRPVETESLVVVALPSVVKPRASNVLCVEIAPAEVVVALPFTQRPVETESLVVVALTKVVKPVTPKVPVRVEFPITAKSLCVEIAPAEVVVALPFTHKPVETESLVVEALTNVVNPVTPKVPVRVEFPSTAKVLCVEIAPAEVVVALPFIQRPVETESLVVVALTRVAKSVTLKVPPVVILVLIVVAA